MLINDVEVVFCNNCKALFFILLQMKSRKSNQSLIISTSIASIMLLLIIWLAITTHCASGFIVGFPFKSTGISTSQFNSQDEKGQFSYGYSHPGQAAVNHRDISGKQVGAYAYIGADGKEVRVSYIADADGYRVIANHLPVAPIAVTETPEVAFVRAAHLALHEKLQKSNRLNGWRNRAYNFILDE